MDVSVIVCTWNNCRRLEKTLGAMAECAIPDDVTWEIVVVNNKCTDGTDVVVAKFQDVLPLVYVHEPVQGLSRARNAGLTAARGTLLIFGDDDITPCREWLSAYWRAFQARPEGFYFGGSVESEFEGKVPDPELLALAPPSVKGRSWGKVEGKVCPDMGFLAANWACPARLIEQAGGFDEAMGLGARGRRVCTGEESDLQLRLQDLGAAPFYLPSASVLHFVPASKCTLSHIGARAEATAFHTVVASRKVGREYMVLGAPPWLWRQLIENWARWVCRRRDAPSRYAAYTRYRRSLGRIRGYRHLSRRHGASAIPDREGSPHSSMQGSG